MGRSSVNISCSRSWSCNIEKRSLSAGCWFIVCTKIAFMFLFDDITGLCVSIQGTKLSQVILLLNL